MISEGKSMAKSNVQLLKEWFAGLDRDEQEEVVEFLYGGKVLLREGKYCGPAPGTVVSKGLYCGPAPAVPVATCPTCGRRW
jgi:hypothetical protein